VDPSTLPDSAKVTHINLNDGTCAGLLLPSEKVRLVVSAVFCLVSIPAAVPGACVR